MGGLPQLRAVSIRQTVGEVIRRALLEGRFQPGQPLSEAALASEMKVSRGPVREALLVLAQEGLVTHSQNYGFSVLKFTEQDRLEVQQVRAPLEVLALQLARRRAAEKDIRHLQALCKDVVQSFANGELIECTQSDLQFHSRVWDLGGNSRLSASLRNLMVPYYAYGSAFKFSRPDLTPDLLRQQHDAYVEFVSGDSRRTAEECVLLHLGI